MKTYALALCLLAGCFDGGTIATCAITCSVDQDCPDDLACSPEGRCSEQGEVCACEANTFLGCNSPTSAQLCVADGSHSEPLECVTSCVDNVEGPHCLHVVPQFVPAVCDLPAVELERIIAGTVSTDDDATCTEVISQGADQPELCVMHARTLTISNPDLVGTRVPVFVADGDLLVERLFVFATGSVPGPGASGRTRGGPPSDLALGGDGAAFIQEGGRGGRRLITPEPDPFPPAAFHGGNSAASEGAVLGGGAGGSTLVISCQGRVTVAGPIDAGGGGGTGGRGSISAAGGGSGGRILIEGMNVTIAATGALWANGGGGGGGVSGGDGINGADALQDNRAAFGGGSGAVLGGDGGFLNIVPTNGGAGTVAGTQGGGGGSVGLIEIAVPDGSIAVLESSEASPAPVVTMALPVR